MLQLHVEGQVVRAMQIYIKLERAFIHSSIHMAVLPWLGMDLDSELNGSPFTMVGDAKWQLPFRYERFPTATCDHKMENIDMASWMGGRAGSMRIQLTQMLLFDLLLFIYSVD